MRQYKSVGYKRRAYEDVARILGERIRIARNLQTAANREAVIRELQVDFTELFARDNYNFDAGRFEARIDEYAGGKR